MRGGVVYNFHMLSTEWTSQTHEDYRWVNDESLVDLWHFALGTDADMDTTRRTVPQISFVGVVWQLPKIYRDFTKKIRFFCKK